MNNKEQFLIEHNKSSPPNLQADLSLLDKFKEAKTPLFKNNNWSIDKLRKPFITWLISLKSNKNTKITIKDKKEKLFRIYPHQES